MAKKTEEREDQAAPADTPASAAAAPPMTALPPLAYDPRPELAELRAGQDRIGRNLGLLQQGQDQLRSDLAQTQSNVRHIAEVNSIENVLCNGFREVREGLDRLRPPGFDRQDLPRGPTIRLGSLRQALASPEWSGATQLPVVDLPVQFIGDAPAAALGYAEASNPLQGGIPSYESNPDQQGSAAS